MVVVTTGSSSGTVADPVGWTRLDDELDGDVRSVAFTRTATASYNEGSQVSFQWASPVKATIALAAYSGVAGVPLAVGAIEPSSVAVATHTTPGVIVPTDGAWVLSYWADKNTDTTGWNEPASQVVRAEPVVSAAPGTTRVTGLLTDSAAASASGARPGLTATANAAATKATLFTIVLIPSG